MAFMAGTGCDGGGDGLMNLNTGIIDQNLTVDGTFNWSRCSGGVFTTNGGKNLGQYEDADWPRLGHLWRGIMVGRRYHADRCCGGTDQQVRRVQPK